MTRSADLTVELASALLTGPILQRSLVSQEDPDADFLSRAAREVCVLWCCGWISRVERLASFLHVISGRGWKRMASVHGANLSGQGTIENIREYPNQEQVRMMTKWRTENEPGTFWRTPADD